MTLNAPDSEHLSVPIAAGQLITFARNYVSKLIKRRIF